MNKKAVLIIKDRMEFKDGSVTEIRLWQVPASKDKPHGYKYSLVYIVEGVRVIGYDNAEGKGDHRHYHEREEPYRFKGVRRLVEDFFNDVSRAREDKADENKES